MGRDAIDLGLGVLDRQHPAEHLSVRWLPMASPIIQRSH